MTTEISIAEEVNDVEGHTIDPANQPELQQGVRYLCKSKPSGFGMLFGGDSGTVYDIRILEFSGNGKVIRYSKDFGDPKKIDIRWGETATFWDFFDLLDESVL